jgi:hypothetical protein
MKEKTMCKRLAVLICGMALVSPLSAEEKRATLAYQWDLDGEAADDNQVIAATALVDNGTSVAGANWTILAQPDVCRLLDSTIVDTNLSAGTLTVTGLGCLGEARVCVFAFTAGDDSGVKTLTCTDGEGAYYSSVTTVTTNTMTGESDETFTLGYTSNSVNGWAMYGKARTAGPNGEHGVDPFASYTGSGRLQTSGSSTTVTNTSGTGFSGVSIGDLLLFEVAGVSYERKVTAKATDSSLTVNAAVTASGVPWEYRKYYFSTNPADDLSVDVRGWKTVNFTWTVDSSTNTGGIVTLLQCTQFGPEWPLGQWEQLNTTTVASTVVQAATTESIDLSLVPFTHCRMGFRLGTGDDGDGSAAATEDINLYLSLAR